MTKFTLKVVIGFLFFVTSQLTWAVTDCPVNLNNYYVGDGGVLYVNYIGGGVGTLDQSSVDYKAILATIMMAVALQKPVTVRYTSDGVSCTTQNKIAGVWFSGR